MYKIMWSIWFSGFLNNTFRDVCSVDNLLTRAVSGLHLHPHSYSWMANGWFGGNLGFSILAKDIKACRPTRPPEPQLRSKWTKDHGTELKAGDKVRHENYHNDDTKCRREWLKRMNELWFFSCHAHKAIINSNYNSCECFYSDLQKSCLIMEHKICKLFPLPQACTAHSMKLNSCLTQRDVECSCTKLQQVYR